MTAFVRVLRWLESLLCRTCGGLGQILVDDPTTIDPPCPTCGGSGILGRDGVDKLRGLERLVIDSAMRSASGAVTYYMADDRPVFARVEGENPDE